jgi:Na+/proline symporter
VLDLGIVVAFVLYSVAVGLLNRKRASRNLEEYFLAGRSVKGWRAGLSMAATQFAADTPLLVMGLIAVGGAFSLWRLWIYGLAFLLMGFVLGAAWRRSGVLTDAELTMIRYSAKGALALRALKAIYYGTVINCVVMAFVLVAAIRIFEVFLPWHAWLPESVFSPVLQSVSAVGLDLSAGVAGLDAAVASANNTISIIAMLIFIALYSTTGGLRSVIATDVAQLVLMLSGTAAYAWFAVEQAGGLSALPAALAQAYGTERAGEFLSFSPTLEDAWIPFLAILSLQWFYQMNSDGTGYLAQRTMACEVLVVFPFDATQTVTDEMIAGRELIFVRGMDELLPAGVRGLMLTAMLAALASTLDTHLNWGASYWSNDLYKAVWVEAVRKRQAGPRELVLVARLSGLVILAIALVIMANLGSIQKAWQVSLLFGAGSGAVLVMRWLWERVNLYSEVFAIVVSLVGAPVLLLTMEDEWLRLATMAVMSTAAVVVAALVMPPTEEARLAAFFERVRPPGWWRSAARAAGMSPQAPLAELGRGLFALVACAVSVYCWLIGFGKLLLQPGSRVTGLLLIVCGVVAMRGWLNTLRKTS